MTPHQPNAAPSATHSGAASSLGAALSYQSDAALRFGAAFDVGAALNCRPIGHVVPFQQDAALYFEERHPPDGRHLSITNFNFNLKKKSMEERHLADRAAPTLDAPRCRKMGATSGDATHFNQISR